MFTLEENTLRFQLKTFHIPGVKNKAADALSRFPVGPAHPMELQTMTDSLEVSRGSDLWLTVAQLNPLIPSEQEIEDSLVVEETVRNQMNWPHQGQVTTSQVQLIIWEKM